MIKLIVAFFSLLLILAGNSAFAGNISTQMQTYPNTSAIGSSMPTYTGSPAISQNSDTNYTGASSVVSVSPNSSNISQGKTAAYSNKPFGNNLKNPSYLNSHFSKPINTNTDMNTVGKSFYCYSHPTNIYTTLADCKTDCSGSVCYVLNTDFHTVFYRHTEPEFRGLSANITIFR